MAGSACKLVPERVWAWRVIIAVLLIAAGVQYLLGAVAGAQELYKYRDENGAWIYSDRPPPDRRTVEVRELAKGEPGASVDVTHRYIGTTVELTARNDYYAPVELHLEIAAIHGVTYPDPEQNMVWVLAPRSSTELLQLELLESVQAPYLEYGYRYMPGDPQARHQAPQPYRAPYAIAQHYPITQAFPDAVTHTGPDSYYAVDFGMPIGTDVFAARGGIVFDVASNNFRTGLDIERDAPAANVVRILHDDGTYAIYAHLNTNTIRVRPGDHVERGDYIADSGNTGYSSGPHLHFAVVRNAGLHVESVPVTFLGAGAGSVIPGSGKVLTAY